MEAVKLDIDGCTDLMLEILNFQSSLDRVRVLINEGCPINHHDRQQEWTALHFAARDAKTDIIHELLNAGAIVDSVDVFGNTPLWRAVMTSVDELDTAKMLLSSGADPNLKNKSGVSPLDIAANSGADKLFELLKSYSN